jgi:hypothetical protein
MSVEKRRRALHRLAHALYRETDANPSFVTEVLRH